MNFPAGISSRINSFVHHTSKTIADPKPRAESESLESSSTSKSHNGPPGTSGHQSNTGSATTTQQSNLENLSFDQLNARADALKSGLERPTMSPGVRSASNQELTAVTNELEIRSLDILEEQLVEKESTENNSISLEDLYDLANDGTASRDTQQAAQFYLDNKTLRVELSNEDLTKGWRTGNITLTEIHARKMELNSDIENLDVPVSSGGKYTPPDGQGNITTNDPVPRDQAVYDLQQDAIEESMRTGNAVEFVNSKGEKIMVEIETHQSSAEGEFTVRVGNSESFNVTSELGIADTIGGIASIVDFGSAMNLRPGWRQFPDTLNFDKYHKVHDDGSVSTGWLAGYSADHAMTFYEGKHGDRFQSTELYYHEMGHGIARDMEGKGSLPDGWQAVYSAAGRSGAEGHVSGYASKDDNAKEGFAEAFAAYMQARDFGTAELEEFRVKYPEQSAYIEDNVINADHP